MGSSTPFEGNNSGVRRSVFLRKQNNQPASSHAEHHARGRWASRRSSSQLGSVTVYECEIDIALVTLYESSARIGAAPTIDAY
jgi:hypothetical protein